MKPKPATLDSDKRGRNPNISINGGISTWNSPKWDACYGGPKAKRDIYTMLMDGAAGQPAALIPRALPISNSFRSYLLQHPTVLSGSTPPLRWPVAGDWVRGGKHENLIVLFHDIKTLQASIFSSSVHQTPDFDWPSFEQSLVSEATHIICHNTGMEAAIRRLFGASQAKYIQLGIFDYLCYPAEGIQRQNTKCNSLIKIALCANLTHSKLLEELLMELPRHRSILYYIFPSEEIKAGIPRNDISVFPPTPPPSLPSTLSRLGISFGLCWWSKQIIESGYLEIIAPHKASCYLAAGVPLICPQGSYISTFSTLEGVGLSIDNLGELPSAILDLRESELSDLRSRAIRLGLQVRNGEFFQRAIMQCL